MRLVWLGAFSFAVGGCGVFLPDVGGVDDPCFGDGTCKPGLTCSGVNSGVCIPVFKPIAGGVFVAGDGTNTTQVEVADFSIMFMEVPRYMYEQCVWSGVCTPPAGSGADCNWGEGDVFKPINCLTWRQAREFCGWKGFRLPTELEWEFAARDGGKEQSTLGWLSNPACDTCNFQNCMAGTSGLDKPCEQSRKVGSLHLCDFIGNVSEYVEDMQNGYFASKCSQGQRVVRGGSYVDGSGHCSVTDRFCVDETYAVPTVGVRCAWNYDPATWKWRD